MYHPTQDPFDPTPTPHHPLLLPLTPIELSYDLQSWRLWFHKNWTLSIYISIFYLVLIFGLKQFMRNKPAFKLRGLLAFWNLGLALFSLGGTIRTGAEMGGILFGDSGEGVFYGSCCRREPHNVGAAFWGLLFTLSKAVELGDTLFIVLRKQPLIFLHWYHHVSVLGYTWFTYHSYDATSRWFMTMNYPVHTLMYTYYLSKSLRLHLPKQISITITILQLAQMVLGVLVNVYALYVKKMFGDELCQVRTEHITLALVMYGSYFLLFVRFFAGSYLKSKVN